MKGFLFASSICLLFVLVAGTLAADQDLVIYYSFNSFSKVVSDESGKKHDAQVVGDVTPNAGGKRGGAANFAKGSYLDLNGPNMPAADVPKEAITLCAWAKPANTGDHHAIFNARATDQTWIVHPEFRSDGKVRWLLRTAGSVAIFDIQNGQWNADQWIHFAGTYDSKAGKGILYLNGEKVDEKAGTVPIAGDWGMGARVGKNIDDARPFTGLMDDFCMFKRALSQAEIKDLMVVGPAGPSPVPLNSTITTTWGKLKN